MSALVPTPQEPWSEIEPGSLRPALKEASMVLVEFWAPDCLFSRLLLPTRAALQKRFGHLILLRRCMVRGSEQVCADAGVSALPALVLFLDGRKVRRWIGDAHLSLITPVIEAKLSAAPCAGGAT